MAWAEGSDLWGLPVFCLGEFLRVVTHRRVFNPRSPLADAIQFLEGLVASPTCQIVRPGIGFLDILATTARGANTRGNQIFDAQIAALCREHGIGTILTNNHDFERFEHLQVRYL